MFLVIEYARMMVGTKAMATLSTGYLNALDYAKIREQGADMTQMADKTAPKVEIIKHPDVRRMLMEQKAHAEGMRALVMFAGWVQDQAGAGREPGRRRRTSTSTPRWIAREDLLLPLVKGYCSEKAYELLGLSLQTFGGSGFTQDYPIEQYIRDAKIDTLYEGTTAIQALDLLFRKIVRDQGATLTWVADQVRELVKAGGDGDPFAVERERLGQALDDAQAHLGVLIQHAMASMDEAQAHRDLQDRAEVHRVPVLARRGRHRLAAAAPGRGRAGRDRRRCRGGDADFYTGKVASARWFARTVLPKGALRRRKAEEEDGWLMDRPRGRLLTRPGVPSERRRPARGRRGVATSRDRPDPVPRSRRPRTGTVPRSVSDAARVCPWLLVPAPRRARRRAGKAGIAAVVEALVGRAAGGPRRRARRDRAAGCSTSCPRRCRCPRTSPPTASVVLRPDGEEVGTPGRRGQPGADRRSATSPSTPARP